MVDFKYYLNRQGVRGQRGEKGDKGFSPYITEKTKTKTEYVLHVQNETDDTSFDTPNLKEGLVPEDMGGTVVRYNRETGQQYYGEIENATEEKAGLVNLTKDEEVLDPVSETSVLSAKQAVDNYTPLSKAEELQTSINDLNTKTDNLKIDSDKTNTDLSELSRLVSMNSNDIKTLSYEIVNVQEVTDTNEADIINLKANKQDKLIAGDNITIENNVISATGGGEGVGDVTSEGDNTFTGSNTFRQPINGSIEFGTQGTFLGSDGSIVKLSRTEIKAENNGATRIILPTGDEWQAPIRDTVIKSQGNLILGANQGLELPEGASAVNIHNKILDKDYNIILSQGNVTAGENIVITKTDKGVQIDALASSDVSAAGDNVFTGQNTFEKPIINNGAKTTDNKKYLTEADVDNQTIQVVDGKLHANMDELGNEVNELSGRVTATEADIVTLQNNITNITGEIGAAAKIDDVNIATTSCFSSDKTTDFVNQQMSALSTTIDAAKQDKLVAGDNISMVNNADGTVTISSSGGEGSVYELPPATDSTLGGIKVGSGLSVTEDGTLSTTSGETSEMLLGHGTREYNNVSQDDNLYYATNTWRNHNNAIVATLNATGSGIEMTNAQINNSIQIGATRNAYGTYSGGIQIEKQKFPSTYIGQIYFGNMSNQQFGILGSGGWGLLFNPQITNFNGIPCLFANSSFITVDRCYPLYTTRNVTAGEGVNIDVSGSAITLSVDTSKFVSIDTYNELLARVEVLETAINGG